MQCKKFDTCSHIKSILSRDWPFQEVYESAARSACTDCTEKVVKEEEWRRFGK